MIHAGYLALALLFFRRRDELRVQRNRWGHVRQPCLLETAHGAASGSL